LTGAKRKEGEAVEPAEEARRKAGGLGWLASCGKKKREREREVGRLSQKREGERGFPFFKFFSNSFFKLSNFTQTRNHAFES
jgi:hypothetical protein